MNSSEPFGGLMPGARGAVLAVLLRTGAALTGRRIHALAGSHSLGAVQQALRNLERIGVITTETVGRAGVRRINDSHEAIVPLRSLASPIEMLTRVVRAAAPNVEAVVVFGSVARGEAHAGSDIDLAVIAPEAWDGRADLQQQVHERLGNDCDIFHLTREDFARAPKEREPVVAEILRDGLALVGTIPRPAGGRLHERATPAAGDAIHGGINAKDAIVTMLTGATSKAKDHARSAGELRTALGSRPEAASAEKALRELVTIKGDVEYGTTLITLAKAEPLVRRARTLVDLATQIVRPAH